MAENVTMTTEELTTALSELFTRIDGLAVQVDAVSDVAQNALDTGTAARAIANGVAKRFEKFASEANLVPTNGWDAAVGIGMKLLGVAGMCFSVYCITKAFWPNTYVLSKDYEKEMKERK